jgi:hypothetical protein
MPRGRLPASSCRHPRVAGLHRQSGRNASPSGITPSTIMSPTWHSAGPRTEIRLGARAHTTDPIHHAHSPPAAATFSPINPDPPLTAGPCTDKERQKRRSEAEGRLLGGRQTLSVGFRAADGATPGWRFRLLGQPGVRQFGRPRSPTAWDGAPSLFGRRPGRFGSGDPVLARRLRIIESIAVLARSDQVRSKPRAASAVSWSMPSIRMSLSRARWPRRIFRLEARTPSGRASIRHTA